MKHDKQLFVQFLIFMIKITVNKFFKQKNIYQQNDNSKKNLIQKINIKKKKQIAMNCFFSIEFFLYLQYLLIKCTNPFYQVLT